MGEPEDLFVKRGNIAIHLIEFNPKERSPFLVGMGIVGEASGRRVERESVGQIILVCAAPAKPKYIDIIF